VNAAADPPGGAERTSAAALREVATLFLKLGAISFGGPAAHIALMREEAVRRRQWVSDEQFLDLLGASNLIPGPTATELAIYLGYLRSGWRGLILGGSLFVLPAVLMTLALACAYVRYGSRPQALWILGGIKPVIIAVILIALSGLAKSAVKDVLLGTIGLGALALYLLGFNPILLLFGGGLIALLARRARRWWSTAGTALALVTLGAPSLAAQTAGTQAQYGLGALFLHFLKIGSVVYGSGYVLLAFLRADFVDRLHWLSDQQLVDAVAVGQFTPGPVFTTATFIGYLAGGVPGAVVATVGIFLPSFVFVAAAYPLLGWLRRSAWAGTLLDGVNVAALGLMAAVSWELGRATITDRFSAALAVVALAVLLRFKINSAWLVLAGALAGVGYHVLTGLAWGS
jgi:chromate transporter